MTEKLDKLETKLKNVTSKDIEKIVEKNRMEFEKTILEKGKELKRRRKMDNKFGAVWGGKILPEERKEIVERACERARALEKEVKNEIQGK